MTTVEFENPNANSFIHPAALSRANIEFGHVDTVGFMYETVLGNDPLSSTASVARRHSRAEWNREDLDEREEQANERKRAEDLQLDDEREEQLHELNRTSSFSRPRETRLHEL